MNDRTCKNCVFYIKHRPDMPKVQWCTNKNFAIMNPDVGCDKQIKRRNRK